MKKITTIFKTIGLIAVVLVMAQGCIPTTPVGGNPTLTNSFDIYLSDEGIASSLSKYKLVVTGDDSIYFTFNFYNANGNASEDFNTFLQSSTGTVSEYLSNSPLNDFVTFPGGLLVSGNMDSSYQWINATSVNLSSPYSNFNQKIMAFGERKNYVAPFLNISINEDRYYVFRRLKGIEYYYYWIKVNCTSGGPGFGANEFLITISGGKRQINNITTGQ